MSTALETSHDKLPTRPLHVLVPLIRSDLDQAKEAGIPYYKAAGEKLIEARRGGRMTIRELTEWSKRNFRVGRAQVLLYMSYANATSHLSAQAEHPSLHQYRKDRGDRQTVYPQAWHEPVKEALGKVDVDLLNRHRDAMKRDQEVRAEHQLALQLIDIGYKALATKLHPDKGGSRDAMARLNRVRDRLRKSA